MPEAVSTPDEFIRKDVFDARMDRIEALLEKTLIEIKADNERLRNEMKGEMAELRNELKGDNERLRNELKGDNERLRSELKEDIGALRGEIRALGVRVDMLQTWQYWQLAWVGIFIAGLTLLPAIVRYIDKKGEAAANRARILLDRLPDGATGKEAQRK